MINTLFNKVVGEIENCVFYFYLKSQRNILANSVQPLSSLRSFSELSYLPLICLLIPVPKQVLINLGF